MNMKRLLVSGLAMTMLVSPITQGEVIFAKESSITIQKSELGRLTQVEARLMAASWVAKMNYVGRGGDYKDGEYKTFQYNGKTYRYLASDIDTRKELNIFLTKTATRKVSNDFIKSLKIIEYKGKMAQPEADGGSLLMWDKAIVTYSGLSGRNFVYEFKVPSGDTGDVDLYHVSFQNYGKDIWRVSNVERKIATDEVKALAADWVTVVSEGCGRG